MTFDLAAKDRYGFEEWLMDEDGQRPVLENFIADLGGVAGLTLLKRVAIAPIRGHYADHYVLEEEADAAAPPSVHVMVNVMTCASSAEAKEAFAAAATDMGARWTSPECPQWADSGRSIQGVRKRARIRAVRFRLGALRPSLAGSINSRS